MKIIKSLTGLPDTNSLNEAIVSKGMVMTVPKKKANMFYAAVSRLKMTKEDRDGNREVKKRLDQKKENPNESVTMNGLFQDLTSTPQATVFFKTKTSTLRTQPPPSGGRHHTAKTNTSHCRSSSRRLPR